MHSCMVMVYMLQPLGYEVQEESDKVCKLKNAIYGLNKSLRAWFDKFNIIVTRYELRQSSSDHSIFVRDSSVLFLQFMMMILL